MLSREATGAGEPDGRARFRRDKRLINLFTQEHGKLQPFTATSKAAKGHFLITIRWNKDWEWPIAPQAANVTDLYFGAP